MKWPLQRDSKANILSISSSSEQIYSEEGLILKMSALESLYCGQFASSTQLIKPKYHLTLKCVLHKGEQFYLVYTCRSAALMKIFLSANISKRICVENFVVEQLIIPQAGLFKAVRQYPRFSVKSHFRYESCKRIFGIILFFYNLMLGSSKKDRENCLKKAFEERNKETQIKS